MLNSELIQKRQSLGISQKLLALKSGVNRYRISDFENSYIELTDGELIKIQSFITAIENIKKSNCSVAK